LSINKISKISYSLPSQTTKFHSTSNQMKIKMHKKEKNENRKKCT
jgi:hypothetical protein